MSLKSALGDVDIPADITFTQLILQSCERFKDKVALVQEETGEQYTYGELAANIRYAASALSRLGVAKGDMIMVFSPNHINYPVLFHASSLLGSTITMCNPLYKHDELLYHMKDSKATFFVTVEAMYETAKPAIEKYGNIKEVLMFGPAADGSTAFSDLLTPGVAVDIPTITYDQYTDVVALPYSSGTTGLPKGVAITSYAFVACCHQLSHPEITQLGLIENEVCLGVVPFYHILGIGIYMGYAMFHGSKVIVMSRFNPQTFIKAIEKYRVTTMHLVPPVIVVLGKHPLVEKTDTSSLKTLIVAGAPLGDAITREVIQKLGIHDIRQLYGMTECLGTHIQRRSDIIPGSVGVILPNTEVKVVNTLTGELCGPNEDGEFWMKGPGTMKHYHNKPEATANTLDAEGFIHSGDIGHYDDNGNFWIVDRIKELIKYNAFQVAPAELENLILGHPAVADVAVVGVPDDKAGELPRAYVVTKPEVKVTEVEIIKFVEDSAAPHKKLRGGVKFIKVIPKLPSGKILRRVLRQDAADKIKD